MRNSDPDAAVYWMLRMPDSLKDRIYYDPTEEGEEKKAAVRLNEIRSFRNC